LPKRKNTKKDTFERNPVLNGCTCIKCTFVVVLTYMYTFGFITAEGDKSEIS